MDASAFGTQSDWYAAGALLAQFAFLAAGIWFARNFLQTVRALQEQVGALLKLSITSTPPSPAEHPEHSAHVRVPMETAPYRTLSDEMQNRPRTEFTERAAYRAEAGPDRFHVSDTPSPSVLGPIHRAAEPASRTILPTEQNRYWMSPEELRNATAVESQEQVAARVEPSAYRMNSERRTEGAPAMAFETGASEGPGVVRRMFLWLQSPGKAPTVPPPGAGPLRRMAYWLQSPTGH